MSDRYQKIKDRGLIGCLNGSGINSTNYKDKVHSLSLLYDLWLKCPGCMETHIVDRKQAKEWKGCLLCIEKNPQVLNPRD